MGYIFIIENKGIEHLNVLSANEGQIKEQKARTKLHMLMKVLDPHILKMLKEEKSQLTKVLLSGDNELDQRRGLFHTRCRCEDKYCDVIIDDGSIDNPVSKMMVTKLKLKRQKHPRPYCISWVQDDHEVMVNEKCSVKFKIESYQDEVLCDIIPMTYVIYFQIGCGSLTGMLYTMGEPIPTL